MSVVLNLRHPLPQFELAVDTELPGQGVTAVFGPSGAGKTTLLRTIAGLETCGHASIQVGDTVFQNKAIFLPVHQRRVGYVFQDSRLFSHLSVAENIAYALKRAPATPFSLTALSDLLGLNELLDRATDALSGGEKQRVAIARALASNPRILLMDEPLASLDHPSRDELLNVLQGVAGKFEVPMIYVSHAIDEVAQIADYLLQLESGQILGQGTIAEMLTQIKLPLAQREDAAALLTGVVSEFDEQHRVSVVDCNQHTLLVTSPSLSVGTQVRLRIAARDVSLCLVAPKNSSILNVLPAQVAELKSLNNAQLLVRLQLASGDYLLARITDLSRHRLGLNPGQRLFAQVKSIAVMDYSAPT